MSLNKYLLAGWSQNGSGLTCQLARFDQWQLTRRMVSSIPPVDNVLDALAVCSKYLSTHKRQNWALVFNKVDPVSSVDNCPCYDIFRAYVPGKSVAKQVDNLGKMARYEPACKVNLEQNPLRKIPRRHKSARERVNLKYNVVSHIDMPSRILIQVNIEL